MGVGVEVGRLHHPTLLSGFFFHGAFDLFFTGVKLVGTGATGSSNANQGYSVTMSGDGQTLAIGGYMDDGVRRFPSRVLCVCVGCVKGERKGG